MKTRLGFVSNSSSSSFIIAFKDSQEKCPTCGRCDPDIDSLKKALESSDEGGWYADGYDKVIEEVKEYGHGEEIISKMNKLKPKGYNFAHIAVSYHDGALNNMVSNSKDIIVLDSD